MESEVDGGTETEMDMESDVESDEEMGVDSDDEELDEVGGKTGVSCR